MFFLCGLVYASSHTSYILKIMACSCSTLEEIELDRYAVRLQNQYKRLGRFLRFTDPEIDGLCETHHNPHEVAYRILLTWRNRNVQENCKCSLDKLIQHMDQYDGFTLDTNGVFYTTEGPCMAPSMFPAPKTPDHLFSRKEQREQIVNLLESGENEKKLLICRGIPGVGKKELIRQALTRIQEKEVDVKVYWPRLCLNGKNHVCTLPEVVRNICHCIFEGNHLPLHDDRSSENLRQALHAIKTPVALILEMHTLNLCSEDLASLWKTLDDVLSSPASKTLKVIVLCLRHPGRFDHCGEKLIEYIYLDELDQDMSVKILQSIWPEIRNEYADCVFQCCGGVPEFLEEVGVNLKHAEQRQAIEESLKMLCHPKSLRNYASINFKNYQDVGIERIVQSLEAEELMTLIIFATSSGCFWADDINRIFGPEISTWIAHLSKKHCVIQCAGKTFTCNSCILALLQERFADNSEFRTSLNKYVSFFLNLLNDLGSYFYGISSAFSPETWQMVEAFKASCEVCSNKGLRAVSNMVPLGGKAIQGRHAVSIMPSQCECSIYLIICKLLKAHLKDIVYILQRGCEVSDDELSTMTICTAVYVLPLLCKVMRLEDLFLIFEWYGSVVDQWNDQIKTAAVQSSLVYIQLFSGGVSKEDAEVLLGSLIAVRSVFDKTCHQLNNALEEVWARNCLLHGFLILVLYNDFEGAEKLMSKGLENRKRKGPESILVADAHLQLAKLCMFRKKYVESEKHAQEASALFRQLEGEHPFSSECYRFLEQIREQFKDANNYSVGDEGSAVVENQHDMQPKQVSSCIQGGSSMEVDHMSVVGYHDQSELWPHLISVQETPELSGTSPCFTEKLAENNIVESRRRSSLHQLRRFEYMHRSNERNTKEENLKYSRFRMFVIPLGFVILGIMIWHFLYK